MQQMNDGFPRVILTEHKLVENIPQKSTVFDEHFSVSSFKNKFQIVVVRHEELEMEFDLIGIHPALANAYRRSILSDVPSMAIDRVHILNNTTIIQDEVLAHRLGLVPIRADPRLFEFRTDPSAPSDEKDTLEFELKVRCSHNKDASKKDSARAEDMYKNSKVYSKNIKWIPLGTQKMRFKEVDIGPIHSDILIVKMRPGHDLDLRLFATKSSGKDHAKFSPVATAFYRLLPDIKLVRPVEGVEATKRFQQCFSPGVIDIKTDGDRVYAEVNDKMVRYDTGSRNVFRYDDLKDAVIMSKIQDHFIFSIESVGALPPDAIFKEAVLGLKAKCTKLLMELNST